MLLELRDGLFDFYHSQDSIEMTTFCTVTKKKKSMKKRSIAMQSEMSASEKHCCIVRRVKT